MREAQERQQQIRQQNMKMASWKKNREEKQQQDDRQQQSQWQESKQQGKKLFCSNCGKELAEEAVFCPECSVEPDKGFNFCQNCKQPVMNPAAEACFRCGARFHTSPVTTARLSQTGDAKRSKLTAGLLGVFLGWLGIHRFYLGYVGIGIVQIVVTIVAIYVRHWEIAPLWGIIEGILILTGTMNKDAQGRPLRER